MTRTISVCIAAWFCSVLLLTTTGSAAVADQRKNGFELEPGLIPARQILRGGPPRDGIPAIFAPKFVEAGEQSDLKEDDRVLGVEVGGIAKAFPVKILAHHEVVNDWTQQTHMLVTYCPLCGSGMAFHSGADGKAVFGVSGLLYNSDVLLYDHASESLWSQILGKAVTGPKRGESLASIAVVHTRWSEWLRQHPDTYVLSRDTGYKGIDYRKVPEAYRGYERSRQVWFDVEHRDNRYHPKAWVLGLQLNGVTKAYPFEELAESEGIVHDELGGTRVIIHYALDSAWAETASGELLPAVRLFWFAWYGFHPDTLVFTSKN
jgi:hypothetical protein